MDKNKKLIYESLENGDYCPKSGLKIWVDKKWLHIEHSESYSCSFYLLGDNILLTTPKGYADFKGMSHFIQSRDRFLKEKGLYKKKYIELKDYQYLEGQTPKESREIFIDMLRQEQDRGYLQGFFGFDASLTIKTLFNIGMSLIPSKIPVVICKNYEKALKEGRKALKDSKGRQKSIRKAIQKKQKQIIEDFYPKNDYVSPLAEDINELYTYINAINWGETEASEVKPLLELDHPFTPLYDALHVLRKDFSDILEKQKGVESNLKKLNEQMEQQVIDRTRELAEKNTILETSLSILSHDTKNLFFNISYLIDQELEGPVRTMFKDSYDELYDNVMETTGYIKEKVRIFSLLEILGKIKTTKDRIPLESHPRIEVKYNDPPEMYYIETTTLFKNTITNIVENALKYTPADKNIIVDINRESFEDQNDSINIQIIDHGKGIPDDEKEKIFQKGFRREKTKSIEGTGRGLWITRNIIEKAGGHLSVRDNPEGGTIFQITVPAFKVEDFNESLIQLSDWFSIPLKIIRERTENLEMLIKMNEQSIGDIPSFVFVSILNQLRMENKEKTQENIQNKLHNLMKMNPEGKSVLIVDDSLYVHYYLATYFTDLGYRIAGFEFNGEKGVQAYKREKPDLITLDNNMPELCGKDAAAMIFEEDPKAKVIFITALGDSVVLQREVKDLRDFNFHILTKPIKKENLIVILDNLQKTN